MSISVKPQRTITMPFLIFYGVGTMIGGGLALLSACSFAELCSRFPAVLPFFSFLETLSVLGFKLWSLA